jgi:hypothetical protein
MQTVPVGLQAAGIRMNTGLSGWLAEARHGFWTAHLTHFARREHHGFWKLRAGRGGFVERGCGVGLEGCCGLNH